MPRPRPLNSLLFLAAVASLLSTQAAAQELKPTGLSHWDSNIGAVRVLPLKDEFDPSSVKLLQNGSYVEIEIRKSRVGK
jgi:hypothetical protein